MKRLTSTGVAIADCVSITDIVVSLVGWTGEQVYEYWAGYRIEMSYRVESMSVGEYLSERQLLLLPLQRVLFILSRGKRHSYWISG